MTLLLLDNTVLSNFALVDCIDLLPRALRSQIATTPQVVEEFAEGVTRGILPGTSWDWLEIVPLRAEEEPFFLDYLRHINAGEAACLAVAVSRNGRFLTDDRDARKLAAQLRIPISGTLGILLRLAKINVLTFTEANDLLKEMIAKGYHSPIQQLSDL